MSAEDARDEFFIGYAATPAGTRRFLYRAASAVLAAGAGAAVIVAALQRDPGDGVWDVDRTAQLAGQLDLRPHPAIRTRGPGGEGTTTLLVGEGKVGAADRLAGLDGRQVTVRGHTLTRGGVRLLEIEDGEGGVRPAGTSDAATQRRSDEGGTTATPPSMASSRRPVTLRGEIVDSKCYAGAMKPGDGKPHKGCAVLCLRGGVPPAFVTADGRQYLVVDESGAALAGEALEAVLPYVGDRVEAGGAIREGRGGDLPLFYLSPATIRRL